MHLGGMLVGCCVGGEECQGGDTSNTVEQIFCMLRLQVAGQGGLIRDDGVTQHTGWEIVLLGLRHSGVEYLL